MTTETILIPHKSGDLTEEQVRKRLEKIIKELDSIGFSDSVIAGQFNDTIKAEFPTFQSITGSWSTNPRMVNVYFQGICISLKVGR